MERRILYNVMLGAWAFLSCTTTWVTVKVLVIHLCAFLSQWDRLPACRMRYTGRGAYVYKVAIVSMEFIYPFSMPSTTRLFLAHCPEDGGTSRNSD